MNKNEKQIQNLTINKQNKELYGEIHSPYMLINEMVDILPSSLFSTPGLKWLDPGCGRGFFAKVVYDRLNEGLKSKIIDDEERKKEIINKMLYLIDINEEHKSELNLYFNNSPNLIFDNYLNENFIDKTKFDVIIGNPPFNCNGIKKVPTNNLKDKKKDGISIWRAFIKKSISLLNDNGYLLFIVPSIWMKHESRKGNLYDYITQYKIHKIKCFSNTETNIIFNKEAQTPTCYFLLQKKSTDKKVLIYDKYLNTNICQQKYVEYNLNNEKILPLCYIDIINKLLPYTWKYGCIQVSKTNLPGKNINIREKKCEKYKYKNIKTCLQNKNIEKANKANKLIINYSDSPCVFYNIEKVILAHGMYGLPYYDKEGKYGISNRDKYIIASSDYKSDELLMIYEFLSTSFVKELYKATRYRMMYLEKYIFRLLPNISKIPNFPKIINDDNVSSFFTKNT